MAVATFAGVFGAIVGSFLNVVIYRLPRRESLVTPGSHCTVVRRRRCKPYDNIPMLSWLLLRGRCRCCTQPISPRYPLVEAVDGGAVRRRRSLGTTRPPTSRSSIVAAPARPRRADRPRAPDHPQPITGPARDRWRSCSGPRSIPSGEPTRLIAGAAAGGFLLLAALAYPRGMGMGDVKLAAVMGLFLGTSVAPAC